MKHTIRYKVFLLHDFAGMCRYLEEMSERGWRLKMWYGNFWNFTRSIAHPLRYCVTYFPKASIYDVVPGEDQSTYIDYCREAGWEFVCHQGPLQVFCTAKRDATPIETDRAALLDALEDSRSQFNKKTLSKEDRRFGVIVCLVLLLLSYLPFLSMGSIGLGDWQELLMDLVVFGDWTLPLLTLAVLVGALAEWIMNRSFRDFLRESRAHIAQGGRVPSVKTVHTVGYRLCHTLCLPLCFLAILLTEQLAPWQRLTLLLLMPVFYLLLAFHESALRRKKAGRTENESQRQLIAVILPVLIVTLGSSVFQARLPAEAMLLRLSDLDVPSEVAAQSFYDITRDTGVLASREEAYERSEIGTWGEGVYLSYTRVFVPMDALYETVLHYSITKDRPYEWTLHPEVSDVWEAEAVYSLINLEDDSTEDTVICYEDYFILLYTDRPRSAAEEAIAVEKLRMS